MANAHDGPPALAQADGLQRIAQGMVYAMEHHTILKCQTLEFGSLVVKPHKDTKINSVKMLMNNLRLLKVAVPHVVGSPQLMKIDALAFVIRDVVIQRWQVHRGDVLLVLLVLLSAPPHPCHLARRFGAIRKLIVTGMHGGCARC